MRFGTAIAVALTAFGSVEFFAAGTPAAFVQKAQAQALPSVWQNKAKKLAESINKSRQSLSANAATIAGDQFRTDQLAKRIENFQSSLARIPSKDDPNVVAAAEQLAALETEFAALGNASAPSPAPATAPATAAAPSESAGSATAATPTPAAPASDVRPLVSGERVRVKKMVRDISNVRGSIVKSGPSELQDPNRIAAYKKRLDQFTAALKRYPQADDPDVIAARTAYKGLSDDLSAEFARAKEQLAELGDVQARLAQIDAHRDTYPRPKDLRIPFTEDDAKAWVKTASAAQTAAQHDIGELKKIAPLAYLPANQGNPRDHGVPYDASDVGALAGRAAQYIKDVNDDATELMAELDRKVASERQRIAVPNAEDPRDPEKAWTYLREGRAEQAILFFDEADAIAKMAIAFKSALGQDPAEANAFLQEIADGRATFEKNRETALSDSRLPESKSDDPEMLAFAKEILEQPRLGFGEYGPIILTTDKITDHENTNSTLDIDRVTGSGSTLRLSGTETTVTFKWKQFRFAAPVKGDDGAWRIWWITAENYSSGGSSTRIGEWIAGKSLEGNLIREENF